MGKKIMISLEDSIAEDAKILCWINNMKLSHAVSMAFEAWIEQHRNIIDKMKEYKKGKEIERESSKS